jgi:hypothetical protein
LFPFFLSAYALLFVFRSLRRARAAQRGKRQKHSKTPEKYGTKCNRVDLIHFEVDAARDSLFVSGMPSQHF